MEIQNSDTKDLQLETVIIITNYFAFKTSHLNVRRTKAKNYICLTGLNLEIVPEYEFFFDKIIKAKWTKNLEEVKEALKGVINDPLKTRFIAVSDEANLQVAMLRDHFGVPGPSAQIMEKFTDKFITKKNMEKYGMQVPKYFVPTEQEMNNIDELILKAEKDVGYPIFSKPGVSVSAKNTFEIFNREDLKQAIEFYKNKNIEFELDEYLSGTLCETDCLLIKEEIKFFCCWKNMRGFKEFLKLKNVGQVMLPSNQETYQRLLNYTKEFIKSQSPVPDNALDIEVWLNKKNELIIQECQLRRPGNTVPDAISAAIGLNIVTCSFELQAGESIRVPKDDFKTPWKQYSGWIEFPHMCNKLIIGLTPFPKGVKSKITIKWLYSVGEVVPVPYDMYDYSANIILVNTDWEQLNKDWLLFWDWHPYVYETK